jgi:hypothetical protein
MAMNPSKWTPGDENVMRMLGQPYDPPTVPAEFAQRVQARMLKVAAETARQRAHAKRRWHFQNRLSALAGVAAMLGILVLGLHFLPRLAAPSASSPAEANRHQLAAAPGERIVTRRGERRRVALADGSVLSLNENTRVRHDASRHLTLDAGEIFVEVAPRRTGQTTELFTVATPDREVRALGTKFLVRADVEGTGVAVTQGQVHVSDWDGPLSAGQQLAAKANAVTPTPRLSYLLDWTRDLVAAATPPLVPPSPHSGGALVAVDPQGRSANLSLRKYHLDVHIEDGFARTTIDQTYFNHTLCRLEGTFFFPLPADASLSRLAMYVDGQLMEGGMVERDYGRIVFDQIVTKMKDPALLEWVDGRTFKMRVFPLEPRQEKRIILSYTQRLPSLYGRWSYRFPAGHSLGAVRDWSFHARVKNGRNMTWHCASPTLTPRIEQGDLVLDASAHYVAMDRDLALDLMEPNSADAVRFSTATQDGYRYLMLRYRPDLPATVKRQRRDWVFLFESSAERDPLLARTQTEIVRTLLANAEHDDTFVVLTAGTQVHAFAPSPHRATPENVAAAAAFLEKSHLLGALDLDAGLTAAAELLRQSEHPVLVHVGCGQAVLGERHADILVGRIPPQACYVGIGVGKGGASELMRRAAERCQGYVTEINPDEPVAWRAFDLLATLNTPRLLGVQVADPEGKTRFLCPTSTVAQGEELCTITRLPIGAPLPKSVCVTGTLDGSPFRAVLAVDSPRSDAAYLPRTWARLEIDRLLGENATKNKEAIIALSKAMYVMTPYTSLLVLENEAMYAQYKVDRGRKDHWAMYPCPPRIPVVIEPPTSNEPKVWDVVRVWYVAFDPVTGEPLNPLDAAEGLNQENNQLGFFAPGSTFLGRKIDAAEGLNQENNQLGFYPPAMALAVKGASTIHTRASNLIVNPSSNTIQLEAPSIPRVAIRVQSDAQLQERIRRENRESRGTQWMMNAYQGYLSGAADITRANAVYHNTIQQAKLVRQEGIRTSLEKLRPMIEEAEWERALMLDPEKIRQQALQRELDRARISPPLSDIWSGRSLNALLRHLIAQQKEGMRGPNVPLSDDTVVHLNLTPGGDVRLLRDNGNLEWSEVLQREIFKENRDKLDKLMKDAYRSLRSDKVPENATIIELQRSFRSMMDTLDTNVASLTPDEYIEASRYLSYVKDTIAALRDPNVVQFFKSRWMANARSVTELIRFMCEKQLQFAPATPKDEAAYVALYKALIAFDAALPRPIARSKPQSGYVALAGYDTFSHDNLNPEWTVERLAALLADPEQARRPSLWRHAARFAERRKQYDTAVRDLRQALELERNRPRDLPSLRRDFTWFLDLADQRVRELNAQQRSVPSELLDWVMEIADQWRAVDGMDVDPCDRAGNILCLAGERELGWSYVTSPAELQRGSGTNWLQLALRQHALKDYDLAERAFVVAASLDPSNAEIIWERFLNHLAAGCHDAARTLLGQLDKGVWDERYRDFQLRARRALEKERN